MEKVIKDMQQNFLELKDTNQNCKELIKDQTKWKRKKDPYNKIVVKFLITKDTEMILNTSIGEKKVTYDETKFKTASDFSTARP